MRFDILIVNITEWIALVCWAIQFKKDIGVKNKIFTFFLLLIAIAETLNMIFGGVKFKLLDIFVNQIIVPTEFLFLLFYLLWKKQSFNRILTLTLSTIYLVFFALDRFHLFEKKTLFDSLSYGVGCLFILIAVIVSSRNFLKQEAALHFTKTSFFWIILGITIFYLGSFPYHNFRTYLWSNKQYHSLAYVLHYTSQFFCSIMYLSFAYAAKWIVK